MARASTSTSPTQRTLKALRDEGWALVEVVEHWKAFPRKDGKGKKGYRKDLFGFVDVLALRENEILGVQACSRGDVATRCAKIADHENVGAVRDAGIRLEVWGWGKMASGKWECRRVDCS